MQKTRPNLRNLRQCLRNYKDYGMRISRQGDWEIHDGGYDLQWELCYRNEIVLGKIRGEEPDDNFTPKGYDLKKVRKTVKEEL